MRAEKSPECASILLVDDNPINLGILSEYLNDSGYEVLIAGSGESAIHQLAYFHPDIILLDIMMPGIDGFETCRRLKANKTTQDIPVIFMTALSKTVNKLRGFEVGAVDYITKPLQQEEVLARIRTHLTIQQQKKELWKLNQRLSESNAMKDKFFSIVSHDLKNAFTTLFSFSERLSESANVLSRDQIGCYAEQLYNALENTFKLLENLLDWARIQKGTMEFEPQCLDLSTLVSTTISLFRGNADQKDIRLSHSVARGTFVYADMDMATTILRNLISNALKFTHPNGQVKISAKTKGKFVAIAISDTGVGIRDEDLLKLFRIDKKYKKSGTAGEKGTGLGLILCKEFMEKNRGRIWAESKVGKGTTFQLHFRAGKRKG